METMIKNYSEIHDEIVEMRLRGIPFETITRALIKKGVRARDGDPYTVFDIKTAYYRIPGAPRTRCPRKVRSSLPPVKRNTPGMDDRMFSTMISAVIKSVHSDEMKVALIGALCGDR